jgi:hypothetical protein
VVVVHPYPSLPLYVPTHDRLLTEDNVNIEVVLIYVMPVSVLLLLVLVLRAWRMVLLLVVDHWL